MERNYDRHDQLTARPRRAGPAALLGRGRVAMAGVALFLAAFAYLAAPRPTPTAPHPAASHERPSQEMPLSAQRGQRPQIDVRR